MHALMMLKRKYIQGIFSGEIKNMTKTESNKSVSGNKRIFKNTMFLYLRMFFGLIVSLYTCRVILEVLGVVDYGISSVVGGFVLMFGFLNNTLSSSLQRFYNSEDIKENGFQIIYNVGLVIHIVIAVVLFILLETFGLWYVNNIMVVPENRLFATNIVYQSSVLSMVLILLQIPYSGAIMAKERMDYFAWVGIFDVISRLLFVFVLPYMPIDKLLSYAGFSLLISIINFILYFVYCRRNFNEIKLYRVRDKHYYKEILSFSGWNLLGTFAWMLKGQGLNMMLNVFFGPVINAARAIAYQINTAISNFSNYMVTAFRPQLVTSYAENDHKRTRKLMFIESKACVMLIALLVIPCIFEIDLVLHWWLGDNVPQYTSIFAILILIDQLINTMNMPLTQVIHAVGKMKQYQMVSSSINLIMLPLGWYLLHIGLEPVYVYIGMIAVSVIHQIACIIVTNKIFYFGLKNYLCKIVLPSFELIFLLSFIPYFLSEVMSDSAFRLVLIVMYDILAAFFAGYYLMLNASEKIYVRNVLIKFLKINK